MSADLATADTRRLADEGLPTPRYRPRAASTAHEEAVPFKVWLAVLGANLGAFMAVLNIQITNGDTGTAQRTRLFSQLIEVPNNGLPTPTVCGRAPFTPLNFAATQDTIPGDGIIYLSWNRSPDDHGGEYDVRQYILYQRDDTATVWRDPLIMVKADTTTAYSIPIAGLATGAAYDFAIAAQDCTPSTSTLVQVTQTAP